MKRIKPKIKVIFFDLGGVIVSHYGISEKLSWLLGISRSEIRRYFDKNGWRLNTGKENEEEFLPRLCAHFGLRKHSKRYLGAYWRASYKKHTHIVRPVMHLVRALRRGYGVGIISDTSLGHSFVNRKRGIFRGLKPILLSYTVHLCKPHRAIYELALKRANVRPGEAVFIDDHNGNVQAALKVGMYGIRFRSVVQLKRELKKLGILWK